VRSARAGGVRGARGSKTKGARKHPKKPKKLDFLALGVFKKLYQKICKAVPVKKSSVTQNSSATASLHWEADAGLAVLDRAFLTLAGI
jgi:hypothetical protein